jgi:hypothetical protein
MNQESEQENSRNYSVEHCNDYFELKTTECADLNNINSQSIIYHQVEICING